MLTVPQNNGWTEFSLKDTDTYKLSWLTDVPSEWLDAAIVGLTERIPFMCTGMTEPGRLICVVSRYMCHIIWEPEGSPADSSAPPKTEHVEMSVLDYCKELSEDISRDIDAWVEFGTAHDEIDKARHRLILEEKLEALGTVIRRDYRVTLF